MAFPSLEEFSTVCCDPHTYPEMPPNILLFIYWKWVDSNVFTHSAIPSALNKYITFSVVLFSKGTWYLNSRGTFMWLCLYWLVVRSVTDHVFWHTSLKAQSAAFKTVPGGLPYRDFWWCLYYFEIKRILHTAVQKHSWNQLLNHLLHLGYTWCTSTWWRLLKTWVVSSRSL